MKKFLIASNNLHKISEIKSLLKDMPEAELFSLNDFGLNIPVDETGDTLEKNALIKSEAVFKVLGIPALSDDTGLFVDALNGEPGVLSARYAGVHADYKKNNIKLLQNLHGIPFEKRTAYFETVVCLYSGKNSYRFFRGICRGIIIESPKGNSGFGYDPLFLPAGHEKTFAELPEAEKNKISHRYAAIKEFKKYLSDNP